MKKTKIEERFQNAANAFFEADIDKNAGAVVFGDSSAALQTPEQAALSGNAEKWLNVSRQLFLFLPGAFLLFFLTLTSVFFIPQIGFSAQMLFWLTAGVFSCWAGLGSLKNTKNLFVPLSIVLFASFFGFVFSLFPREMQTALFFDYSIYLFPIVLIGSKLLKNRLDENENHLL